MKKIVTTILGLILFYTIDLQAQDFSGLQNKTLEKTDDVMSKVTSGIGALLGGGKVNGSIEAVKVFNDTEHELKIQISYRGYQTGVIKVHVTNRKKQKLDEVKGTEINLAGKTSPVECVLNLNADYASGQVLEAPFLKIEYTKDGFVPEQVTLFALNKNWKQDIDPENVIVMVKPQPIGSATQLKANEIKDATPSKSILFQNKLYYNPKLDIKMQSNPIPGVGAFNYPAINTNRPGSLCAIPMFDPGLLPPPHKLRLMGIEVSDNISGTWTNTDPATRGITKIIITGNRELQVFGKCSPTDCNWGKKDLTDNGNNTFKTVYDMGFVVTTIDFVYTGSQLTAAVHNEFKDNRGSQSHNYTFQKNTLLLTNIAIMPAFSIKDYATNAASTPAVSTPSLVPEGPESSSIYLWAGLKSDVDFENPQDLSNINMNVFPDKNPYSGVFYFLPANYHLKYEFKAEPERGYNMNILYGARNGADDAGQVRMSARLTAGISSREMNFMKTLLKAGYPAAREVKLMPLRENPVFSFQSYLSSQFNIPQDKIAVESSTDLFNDIRVSWQTDANTKEFIQSALLSREGLGASVILKPQAEGIIDQQIPVIINLADNNTLGKITLDPATWRSKNLRNTTPYPLQFRNLNILKISGKDNMPIIYSWTLNNTVVPSKSQVMFDPSLVPAWLDNPESVLMWIDYAVMDCNACDQKVIDALTGGVSGSKAQMVKFIIPPVVFDSLHAAYFLVQVRSKALDANGVELRELPENLKVTKDADKEFTAGPFFIPANGSFAFDYKITLATVEGEFIKHDNWIPATDKEILLGKTKLKEILNR